jgi:hypothetical protein
VIQSLGDISFSIFNISALSPRNRLVQLLKLAIRTAPSAIAQIRFTSNTINNVFVEDALIYRLS